MGLPSVDPANRAALESHDRSPFFRAEIAEMLACAELAPGMRSVDVGSGNGILVGHAARMGVTVGMDASLQVVQDARARSASGAFVVGAANALPILSGSVDRVFAQHIIEHLRNPSGAIGEWHRVLRPGGRLVVLTPNARYPDPAVFEDPTHVRIFGASSLRAMLHGSGFQVIRVKTVLPYLGGHTVFGLRHRRMFARLPPWSSCGRSLIAVAEKGI